MTKVNINPAFSANDTIKEFKTMMKSCADFIQDNMPESDQKSKALMDLQSAQMFAVSSLFGDS